MLISEAIEKYSDELRYLRGRTARTVSRYKAVFRSYISATGEVEIPKLFTVDNLTAYAKKRQAEVTPSTVAFELVVLKAFTNWLFKKKQLEDDPFDNIPPFRWERPAPRAVKWSEAEAQVDNASVGGKYSKRDYALLYFILHTACRSGEALNCSIDDLDMEEGKVLFVNTKGKKPRLVYLSKSLQKVLKEYLPYRQMMWPKSELLFPSWRGGKLVKEDLTLLKKRYGLTISVGQLRPSAATKLLKETKDLRLVQSILGHASIATTERYLTVWDEDKKLAAEAMDK